MNTAKSNALKIIYQLKKRSNANANANANNETLFITSDGNDDYTDAIQSAYGDLNSGTGESEMPATLCYAQVVKTIEKGKCTAVKRKLVLGSEDLLKRCLSNSSVSYQINTSFVERSNLAMRQHNHRVERKTQGFSKEYKYLKGHNSLAISYYNLCLPHSSLLEHKDGTPVHTTPAMAAQITDSPWSMTELLSAKAFL